MVSMSTLALIASSVGFAAAAAPAPKWNCTGSYDGFIPVRIDSDGDVQCWSNNGKNCVLNWDMKGCLKLINNPATVQPTTPLSCGCMHKSLYSGGGYTQWGENYWCARGMKLLNATPPNPDCKPVKPWQCTNFYGSSTPVRLDKKGDVQCWSDTGKNCLRFDTTKQCVTFLNTTTTKPVAPWSCGCAHRAVEWTDGYTMNGNTYWCATGKVLLKANPPSSANCTKN